MGEAPCVFVVDDDEDLRRSMRWMLDQADLQVSTHASAEHFLGDYEPGRAGCVVADVRMPGMTGLELLEWMAERRETIPFIMMTAYADVPMAVRAMEHGAMDFMVKPFAREVLLGRIAAAIERDARLRQRRKMMAEDQAHLALLTPREREVMEQVVAGKATKQIAHELGISDRTVEVHRGRITRKLEVDSLADMVRLALRCGVGEG